ncbi:NAD-glutamate dehydrogenase domain-containing protein [Methylomarinum vadi]|uniref:NAD-glutamate dehydrogenase domain-containing protein n=1 Tax=Methylomarinum vadi TaxID=438855 RepID=UPI0004DECC0E|nr:NAD-glutamate dehydrogenase domain-containing protein [Methylomarinum vadi]
MKVYLEAGRTKTDKSRQHLKLEQVQYLLDRHENIEQRRFLKTLADVLIFPESYLATLPSALLDSLIVRCYQFLENRTQEIGLQAVPLQNGGQYLLMISAPNEPYLVETLIILQKKYSGLFSLIAHPILTIKRREQGIIYLDAGAEEDSSELLILLRLENIDQAILETIQQQCLVLLRQNHRVFQSCVAFNDKQEYLKSLRGLQLYWSLLAWLQQEAFIPISYRAITTSPDSQADYANSKQLGADLAFCLEILEANAGQQLQSEINRLMSRETEVVVHRLTLDSPLISNEPLIYIGFREQQGDIATEHAFIGLFRRIEINCSSCHVLELQRKTAETLKKIKIVRGSHDYVKLQELFSLIPKLEFFFLGETQLELLAQSLCRYLSRPYSLKVLFLASPSPFCLSFLVIIPQTFLKTTSQTQLAGTLSAELQCRTDVVRLINFGESYSALYLSLLPQQEQVHIDIAALEKLVNRQCRPWTVRLRLLLERALGKGKGSELWRKYRDSFNADYRNMLPPRYALKDMLQLEKLTGTSQQGVNLLFPCQRQENCRLHFYSGREQFLDEFIPILENLNLRLVDQVQFSVNTGQTTCYIKSFAVIPANTGCQPLHKIKQPLLGMIEAIQQQRVENDGLNRLLLLVGMEWQEIDLLRTYRNYCLQLGFHVTVSSFHRALINNPRLAKLLFDYFEVRFRPSEEWEDALQREEQALFPIRLRLLEDMETVTDLNDDRILRTLFNLIDSTVRSNFHVRRGLEDYLIALKINSLGVIDMPAPRPSFEVYVHAPDMEGIHLRGGKIARGGIRWSDRPDDFRTEILGLMQTQMSKNALIVPTGAKGGFVVKRLRRDESFRQAGKRAYLQLMRALLDLTDNYVGEKVKTLSGIVRYDDDDPYLVVAADKGTAQFPDVANAVSEEYRFWMGDAFASGGSKGYSHKALGITARGAWESVKRHFRELGKDIQHEAFTVVGIGSMDGDVFGNGMLLSRCIKLRAAISGQHIFLDPSPDPERSYQERRRLFDLPGSSWNDYSRELLSEGGGIYSRDSKDIPLSEPVRQWLGLRYKTLDGESLIRYLLIAPVELLWLGGIGTYVKAGSEKHEEVGDRQNDTVRVDASSLQAKVVGEGANLGFTRLARIEFALAGGRINTDAIDNSAGVDTSDHEVNLKILLRELHKKQQIDDYQTLFDQLSEEVCRTVLADNYAQTLCLSLEQLRCAEDVEPYLELAEKLQSAGFLDFAVEAFPVAKAVRARENVKLTRPELAVLMASAKRWLTQQLLDRPEFVTATCCDHYLLAYFPRPLVERFAQHIPSHPLASAIKATCISNLVINQAGCLFLARAIDNQASDLGVLMSSYLAFDRILAGEDFRKSVFALDNRIEAALQYGALLKMENRLTEFSIWSMLNDAPLKPTPGLIGDYLSYLEKFVQHAMENGRSPTAETTAFGDKLPESLSQYLHRLALIEDFPASVRLSIETGSAIETIADLYVDTAECLFLQTVRKQLNDITLQNAWERKLYGDLEQGVKKLQGGLVKKIVQSGAGGVQAYFFQGERQTRLNRYQRGYHEIAGALQHTLTPYLVWYKELERLLEAI